MAEIDLNDLADRVEKLEAPCRETDALIHRAVYPDQLVMTDGGGPKGIPPAKYEPIGTLKWSDWGDIADMINSGRYTASIDAAMTLVPEGAGIGFQMGIGAGLSANAGIWAVSTNAAELNDREFPCPMWQASGNGSTLALALTACALRARLMEGEGE